MNQQFFTNEIVITRTKIDGAKAGEIGVVTGYCAGADEYWVKFLFETTLARPVEIRRATDAEIFAALEQATAVYDALKASPSPRRYYARMLNRAVREKARLREILALRGVSKQVTKLTEAELRSTAAALAEKLVGNDPTIDVSDPETNRSLRRFHAAVLDEQTRRRSTSVIRGAK